MSHRHRWKLGPPDGEVIHGVCKCGAKGTWPAAPPEFSSYALKRRIGTEATRRKAP